VALAPHAALGDSGRFIDKMPLNYLYCGLIHRALPNAKIIHLTRHPIAVGYAMYKTLFKEGYPFSYDLSEIAQYYIAREIVSRRYGPKAARDQYAPAIGALEATWLVQIDHTLVDVIVVDSVTRAPIQRPWLTLALYPYAWYKRYVLAGAREHNFPSAYISEIEAVRARPDPKPERSAAHEPLLSQLESALEVRDAPPSRP
jgi:hypothetical protein